MGKNVENEPPVTVPDLIMSAATKYSHYLAIGSKYKKSWQLLTYIEYYEACRRAAKAFLKVLHVRTPPAALLAAAWDRVKWLLSPSTSGCSFAPLRVTPAISHVDYLPLPASVSRHTRVILHIRRALVCESTELEGSFASFCITCILCLLIL